MDAAPELVARGNDEVVAVAAQEDPRHDSLAGDAVFGGTQTEDPKPRKETSPLLFEDVFSFVPLGQTVMEVFGSDGCDRINKGVDKRGQTVGMMRTAIDECSKSLQKLLTQTPPKTSAQLYEIFKAQGSTKEDKDVEALKGAATKGCDAMGQWV